MHPLRNIAVRAARQAGNIIARALDRLDTITVSAKSRNDFVTDIDKLAEAEIISVIRKAYPDHSIMAEESGEQGASDSQWIIDPLDGTTNFLHGFPQFAVSIAVAYRGVIEHGVIYDPVRQELFSASRGAGAQLNDRRIRVSAAKSLEGALLGTGFPFRDLAVVDNYLMTLRAFIGPTAGIRRAGSAALDLAYVAAGRLDGFWEFGLKPWDLAAGSLLTQEAGGMVSDWQGTANYVKNGHIVTGAPKVHQAMLQILRETAETGMEIPRS